MTPILIVLFGVPPATAVGTDLLFAAATKTVGSLVHGFNKTIEWRIVRRLAIGSLPATALALVALSLLHMTCRRRSSRDYGDSDADTFPHRRGAYCPQSNFGYLRGAPEQIG